MREMTLKEFMELDPKQDPSKVKVGYIYTMNHKMSEDKTTGLIIEVIEITEGIMPTVRMLADMVKFIEKEKSIE